VSVTQGALAVAVKARPGDPPTDTAFGAGTGCPSTRVKSSERGVARSAGETTYRTVTSR
jgi:hypothetical protein